MTRITDCLKLGNIYFEEKLYTPETIRANIDAVAEILLKKFISNSPFVYLFAPNHIKMVYALFGILAAGKTCVLVDPKIGRFELEEMLKDSPPGAIIKPETATDTFNFNSEFEFKHYQLAPSRIAGMEDVAIMLYTAADDGFAKGAMLTHENILLSAEVIVNSIVLERGTVSFAPISFHHLFSLMSSVIAPGVSNGDIVIADMSILERTRKLGTIIESKCVTHFHAVPFVYYLLSKDVIQTNRYRSIKIMISGGNKLSSLIADKFKRNSGIDVWEGYGLTETSLAITWHHPTPGPARGESVGRPLSCCQIRILSKENSEVPTGQAGEICVRGQTVMKGYYGNKAATEGAVANGWFHTGDLGRIDENGFLYLTGLRKKMLNLGGNKVYPAELERLMMKNNNVLWSEVSGEPDELLGEKVRAKIRLRKNTAEEQNLFREWCLKNITRYKVPRVFDFVS